jgi:hypothetical protein
MFSLIKFANHWNALVLLKVMGTLKGIILVVFFVERTNIGCFSCILLCCKHIVSAVGLLLVCMYICTNLILSLHLKSFPIDKKL